MKRSLLVLLLAGIVFFLSGCYMVSLAPPMGPRGLVFTDVTFPGDHLKNNNEMGPGPKEGKASTTVVLGLFSFGDNSIKTACKAAEIKKVRTVDYHQSSFLFLYWTWTTIVSGE